MVFGINLNWRGIPFEGLIKVVEKAMINLANASVARYPTRILFPRVMAYILRRIILVRPLGRPWRDVTHLSVTKTSEENRKNIMKASWV